MKEESTFRVVLITKDGSLVMNRPADSFYYFHRNNQPNQEFINLTLKCDCREKGVRLISHTINTKTGIRAIVDWC